MRCLRHTTRALALLLCVSPVTADEAPSPATRLSLGEQIYREGRLASGAMLQARVQGDVRVSGAQLICAQCHRRSGYGSSESGSLIPPITAGVLFRPKQIGRRELYAARQAGSGTRPAYTEALLARAIRDGLDAAGRPLDPAMPRFDLPPGDMQALIAYLETLSATPDPGVETTELHIATLIGPDVPARRSEPMLALMRAFIEAKNGRTRLEQRRAEHTPWQKEASYPAYRKWVLHTWQLRGTPGEWPAQLQQLYHDRPVFAVVGGVVDGDFQPIADFCNARSVPCLFPTSAAPATTPGFYTVHFSEGRRLEAHALAVHLRESGLLDPHTTLTQLYRRTEPSGATALRQSLPAASSLRDLTLDGVADARFWQRVVATDVLVAWLPPRDLAQLAQLPKPWPQRIYLQSQPETSRLRDLPAELRERIYLLYPYALPATARAQRLRVSTWLRRNGIGFDAPHEQADSYFALTLFGDVMRHLGLNYSRAYALETIEHMLDSAIFTSFYPRVSLAPGQRFASKGCYVVRLADNPATGVVAASRWIVP